MRGTAVLRAIPAASALGAWLLVVVAGGTVLASCQKGQAAGTDSGAEGLVTIGPMCPVIQAGQECPDQPLEANLEIEDQAGSVVARGGSDGEGHFRIPLEPGEYLLRFVSPNPGGPPSAAPVPFRVEEGRWTNLTVLVDSGIR